MSMPAGRVPTRTARAPWHTGDQVAHAHRRKRRTKTNQVPGQAYTLPVAVRRDGPGALTAMTPTGRHSRPGAVDRRELLGRSSKCRPPRCGGRSVDRVVADAGALEPPN